MRRKAFDTILTAGGLVLAIVLVIAGGLLLWGHNFANGNVRNQLAEEQIFFPAKASPALASPEIGPYLDRYAGQQLLTGAQAKAYADHFIRVHLHEMAGGKTYAQVSAAAQADPTNTTLQKQTQTLFQGETLRGLLLEAYGFWKMGQLALLAATASFVLAAVMLVLSALGFVHLRRVSADAEVLAGAPRTTRRPVMT